MFKLFSIIVMLSMASLSFAVSKRDADRLGRFANVRIVASSSDLKDVNIVSRRAGKADFSTSKDCLLRTTNPSVIKEVRDMANKSSIRKITLRSEASLKPAAHMFGACNGPGHGSGVALSPMVGKIGPNAHTCVEIWRGPPQCCVCEYGCGAFLGVKYCYQICGGILLSVFSANPDFSCSISGTPINALPGSDTCPLSSSVLCNA